MGRVTNPSPPQAAAAPPPPPSTLKHFTHPHDLHPLPFCNPQTVCSGCKLQSSGTMYTCTPCAFTLHQSCATLPPLITHPSHGGCTLSLLAVSSYPGGVFSCNACGHRSNSWNYHCAACEYDLHVTCAAKPLRTRHASHATCELELTFKNPYGNSTGFSCDVCRKTGSKQWLYRCGPCEYDAHLECVDQKPVLRHQHSAPQYVGAPPPVGPPHAGAVVHHGQLMHSASTGAIQNPYNQGPVMNTGQGQGYGYLGGNPQMVGQNNQPPMGGGLMAAAFQGFVEGAFQGVGQAVVQEVITGDAGGNGTGGNGGGGGGGDGGGDGGGGDTYSY